jgi:hypothetical protein
MPLAGKGIFTIDGQLSLPARKTTAANAQVAFDLGRTLVACFKQPECLKFELPSVRPSGLFHRYPSDSGIIHDLLGLSSCPLFRGKVILVGIPIAMLNLLNQFAVLLLVSGADYLTAFEADQLHAQVMLFLDLYQHGIFIAKIFWGLWLFPLGYLVFKSGFLPRILGVVLIISGLGYLIDDFMVLLLPNSGAILSLFAFIGEWLFALWLLIKGVNVEQWEKRAKDKPR